MELNEWVESNHWVELNKWGTLATDWYLNTEWNLTIEWNWMNEWNQTTEWNRMNEGNLTTEWNQIKEWMESKNWVELSEWMYYRGQCPRPDSESHKFDSNSVLLGTFISQIKLDVFNRLAIKNISRLRFQKTGCVDTMDLFKIKIFRQKSFIKFKK